MITLKANKFDILNIESELNLKVGGIKELSNKVVLEELANAVFTLSSQSFVKAMNIEAKGNPKTYHHIYEWNKIGLNSGRLFFLYKESSVGGKLIIKPGFIKSKTKVPVSPELLAPGRTGKSVASRHVFRDKASIMESGKPVIFRASKPTPIPSGGKLSFVAAGTIIRNYNPGGKKVKGSFEKFYNNWFNTKVNSVISSSGIMDKIDAEIAKVLNNKKAGPTEVRNAIINLLKQYSKGVDVV
jgi:hypothetical protein